ncbi:type III pantothenate kinase [Flavobacterium lindanitolerans]|uniref:Type III pantothenate kinase n=2 Tax=Flavobacterium TaxID=237 RepID=A0A497V5I0_9FLAO|nr:type III pantothenate kinase [Flavobacterium lindanitolerans]PKW28527.1 type III pantothenate kinase [Flavobacterium lindanitolerans]RLJ35968.1 type III pantothenate kinase [Flavobacterium lindanitolerans]
MLLAIDVGNTRIKGAVFENDSLLGYFIFLKKDFRKNIEKILKDFPKTAFLVVASVGSLDKNDFLDFGEKLKVHFISHEDSFPFVNLYETPKTLGMDRMVLAAGAVLQFPKQNRLVIDAGTCITYDFVDENDNYLGGAISPGLRLRYEALHNFTARLPLLELDSPKSIIGNSTSQSIHSGVVNGAVNEIDGFINDYKQHYSKFTIILTGGDAEFLAKRLKNTIFANSNFLLESLSHLFQYKIKND